MNEPLAEMLRYNAWANETLFAWCATLDDALLDARAPGASGTVRELLVHIAGGQQTFVLRTMGRQHEGELHRASAWPGFDALLVVVGSTNDELIAIAGGLDQDREVDLRYRGQTSRHLVSFFLAHAVAHGAGHRTEIALTLNGLGLAAPDLDGWAWGAATGRGSTIG